MVPRAIALLLAVSIGAVAIPALEPQTQADERVRCWIRVLDAVSGAPIADAEVGVRYAGRGGMPPPPLESDVLEGDTDGLVLFTAEPQGMPYGVVRAPGFADRFLWPRPGHERAENAVPVSLLRAASVRCQVLDQQGEALAGVRLQLSTESYRLLAAHSLMLNGVGPNRDPTWSARTDGQGWALIDQLPPRVPLHPKLTLAGGAPGKSFDLTLATGEYRIHRIRLGTHARLSGRVIDGARKAVAALPLILVRPRYFSATRLQDKDRVIGACVSDSHGHFEFAEVPSGRWLLGVAKEGRDQFAASAVPVVVEEGSEAVDAQLQVWRGRFLNGTVVDVHGEAVAAAWVTVVSLHGLGSYPSQSDVHGRFRLGPLPAGRFHLSAHQQDAGLHAHGMEVEVGTPAALRGGPDRILVVHAQASLSGQVLGGADEVGPQAEITLAPRHRPWGMIVFASDHQGRFQTEHLAAGVWDLVARSADGRVAFLPDLSLVSGSHSGGTEARLQSGTVLELVLAGGREFLSVEVYLGDARVDSIGLYPGSEQSLILPPGRVRLQARYGALQVPPRVILLNQGDRRWVVFAGR